MPTKKKVSYFSSENKAAGFMDGLEEANDGSIHRICLGKSIDYPGQYFVRWITKDAREEDAAMPPEEYAELKGGLCPACRHADITGYAIRVSGMAAIQEVTCCATDCAATWEAIYTLTGYGNLKSWKRHKVNTKKKETIKICWLYAHMSPEYLLERAEQHGLSGKAADFFRHFEEVKLEVEVEVETGEVVGVTALL